MPHDEFVPEDPMGLVGIVLPGEPGQLEAMAECFVEEYARMGWDERRLMTLFVNPTFLATHRIYRSKGEEYVRSLINMACEKWAVVKSQTPTSKLQNVVEEAGCEQSGWDAGLGSWDLSPEVNNA